MFLRFGPVCFWPEPVYFGPGKVHFGPEPVYFGLAEPPVREPLDARTIGFGARSWLEPIVLETTACQSHPFWSQTAGVTVASESRSRPEPLILEVTSCQNQPFWSVVAQSSWLWSAPTPEPPVLLATGGRNHFFQSRSSPEPSVLQRAPGWNRRFWTPLATRTSRSGGARR